MPRKLTNKGLIKKLDKLWREMVYKKANYLCEFCGAKRLNAHHIYSRSAQHLRWDVENGVNLCPLHHRLSSEFSAHKTPLLFADWIIKKRGKNWHRNLKLKLYAKEKVDKKNLLVELEKLNA
jgi:hypothetical protein